MPDTVNLTIEYIPAGNSVYYHPHMRVGNVFSHVCVSVYVSVYVSVFLSVQAITFEMHHIETSFWYAGTS